MNLLKFLVIFLMVFPCYTRAEEHSAASEISESEYKEFQEYQKFKRMKKASEASPSTPTEQSPTRPAVLSREEQEILERGEVSTGAYVGGGVVGTLLGVGIGHAIQGRYSERGWIFTVGELLTASLYAYGAADCAVASMADGLSYSWGTPSNYTSQCSSGLATVAAIGLLGFRIWEIIDLWAVPPSHNDEFRRTRDRIEGRRHAFLLAPSRDRGLFAGYQFRF